MDRTKSLLQIKPDISIENNSATSELEKFQNEVLRPLLKFQNDYMCFTFLNAPNIVKLNFLNKHKDQKAEIITETFKSNHKLKAHIIHSITSLMTMEELECFQIHKTEFQKRIISMATQRLINGLCKE